MDQSNGDLLVIEKGAGAISRYKSNGEPDEFSSLGSNKIEGLSFGTAGEVQIAVDNSGGATDGDIYVPLATTHVVDIFSSSGELLGQLTESSEKPFSETEPCGVAVDPSGNVYVGDFSGHIHKYEPAANPPVNGDNSANFAFAGNCTLAAGAAASEGFIFPIKFGNEEVEGKVSKLDAGTGEVKYEVTGPTTTDTIDPATGQLYTAPLTEEGGEGEVREFDVSGSGPEQLPSINVPTKVTGIAADGATGNVYVARAESATIEVWGPAVALPKATTTSASVVGDSVTLRGVVNAAEGPPATCVFEYVEIHAEGFKGASSVPCSPAGPFTGNSPVLVSAEVNLPEAAYRYRLVASNENGSNSGQPALFNTFERVPGLPDGRSYELVSPAQKLGEVIPPEAALVTLSGSCESCLPGLFLAIMPMQSAPGGDAVLYEGQPFSGGLSSGPNEYLAARGQGGWETQGISEPSFEIGTLGQGYKAFSSDLSRGILFQVEPLAPQAPTREGKGFANLYLRDEDGSLEPLVTEEPPNRSPGPEGNNRFQILFAGANAGAGLSPAFSHIVFQANDSLTKDVPGVAPPAPEVAETGEECRQPGTGCNLYEWVGGQLRLVNVLPENKSAAPGGVLGSGLLQAAGREEEEGSAVDHAISDDGSRIFWSEEESGQLYVRIDGEETKKIEDPGLFLTATPDGSKVLLRDGCLYDLEKEECEADLSQGHGGEFRGILGAAEDLSRVYFVDSEVLTEEENENCEEVGGEVICEQAEEGELNLYVWEEGEEGEEGQTSFIGALNPVDNSLGGQNGAKDWIPSRSGRTAQVSANGGYLAFMSKASLTGYDNRVSGGGECKLNGGPKCFEVFVYAAGSGTLTCASCNPSGARPLGLSTLSVLEGRRSEFPPFPQPGNLSSAGGGRVFFQSLDSLSPRDVNGKVQDVYEWEPNGVGSCERAAGCVNLISGGTSPSDSMFLDSTPSGNDAFFITRQQLLPADRNDQLDLYDARVGGGFKEPTTAPCEGEACKGPASSPPPLSDPASRESSGPGNPPKQKKPPKKHKKHHHKKHHRGGSK